MSFIPDQLRSLDLMLERLQIGYPPSEPGTPSAEFDRFETAEETVRVEQLKRIIKQLTTNIANTSTSHHIPKDKLLALLKDVPISSIIDDPDPQGPQAAYERELEWLLVAKATILVYGITFYTLLEQTLPLSEDLFYWDEVLGSYRWTALYSVQTAPVKLLYYSKEIYGEAMKRFTEVRSREPSPSTVNRESESLSDVLRKFFSLVQNSIRDRATDVHRRVIAASPLAIIRHDIRTHQNYVRRLRAQHATAIGILVGEALNFYGVDDPEKHWKRIVERAVILIGNMVRDIASVEKRTLAEFEHSIMHTKRATTSSNTVVFILQELKEILEIDLPAETRASRQVMAIHGRPGRIVRYWAPASLLLFSSTRILSVLARRQADLKQWARESAVTAIDFWNNWVIDPIKRVIGTIRHDEESEVALMSRKSLSADMESLERMVVDFAMDNPDVSTEKSTITPQELEVLRQAVKEGDLTPVLRAYERDLRRPFKGAVRGELIRALLIQIQKTKVDVEVAITGIDRLLKSQELVFGVVGLTPGLLATWGVVRWFAGIMGGRKGMRRGKVSQEMLRVLRHIDRILSSSTQKENLSYKEHGLLLCEVVVLRELAKKALPANLYGEFAEEMNDLANIHVGIQRQQRVVDRVKWAYAKWIHCS